MSDSQPSLIKQSNRKKILAVAYACNPYHGTEWGVGWGWVKAIASLEHDVWVIVAEFHRAEIEDELAQNPDEYCNIKFCFVDRKPWHYRPSPVWRKIDGSILKVLHNYAYKLWQRDAYQLAKKLHQDIEFDLCHLITYVGFRFPGAFWKLDIPFVWGPIGGLENTPWRFLPSMGLYGCFYYAGRNIVNAMHRVLLPGPKHAFAKAGSGVIAATEGIRREIKRWYGLDSHIICEIGPPATVAQQITERNDGDALRLAWSGEHLPGKAFPLLLEALVLLPEGINWTLDVLGDGPCNKKWKAKAEALGIDNRCRWSGLVPREQAVSIMHDAHVFVITSLKDLTSSVLLEALSQGVPVICPDHCGFSNVINDCCGIKLALNSPAQFSSYLSASIQKLAENETLRRHLANGALRRIQDYSWENKAAALDEIYNQVTVVEPYNHA